MSNVVKITPTLGWQDARIMRQETMATTAGFKEINVGEFLKQVKTGCPKVAEYRELFSAFTLATAELVKAKERLAKIVGELEETHGKESEEYKDKAAELKSVCAEYNARKGPIDKFKKTLPAFTVAGTFKGRRAKVDFVKSSGIFLIDIDKIPNPEAVKTRLKEIPSLAFAFISPSENGVKAGFRVQPFNNDKEFKAVFKTFQSWLADFHAIEIDDACKDISRLCFVSHDPDIYINETPELFQFEQVDAIDVLVDEETGEIKDSELPETSQGEYSPYYIKKVIEKELHELSKAGDGERNNQLNKSAFALFGLLYSADRDDLAASVRKRLQAVALGMGLTADEIEKTLTSAYNARSTTTRKPPPVLIAGHSDGVNNTSKLEKLNENYSLVILGGVAKVMQHNSQNEYDTMSTDAFKTLMSNVFMQIGTADSPRRRAVGGEWCSWVGRKTYKEGVCFEPYSIDPPKNMNVHKLNTWTGFPYEPIPYDNERIEVITEYILEIVCHDNRDYFDYLIRWLARGFQEPAKQAEVAVVLRGSKGSGKGTLGKLIKKMWGAHGQHITSSKHLTGNFNAHLKNCGFLFADEAFFAGDKAGEANLQTLITEPTMMVEYKGVNAFESKNCLKILMASNKEWVIPSSKDERRYFCLDIEESEREYGYQSKTDYFNNLYKAIGDKTTMAMFMDYMLKLDLTGFDIRSYPETTANKAQRIASLNIIPRFLLEACERGYIILGPFRREAPWYEKVTADVIAKGVAEWGKDNFKSNYDKPSLVEIKNYLNKTLKIKSKPHRGMTYIAQDTVLVHSHVKAGYNLGTAEELKEHIIKVEKLPAMGG